MTANPEPATPAKLIVRDLTVFYGEKKAVGPVGLDIVGQHVTALIGPSGCGKSTFLRSLNRMNELIPGCRITGDVKLDGDPIYGPGIDPVAIRRRIGMVFQRSNPFPKTIKENVAYGLRIGGMRDSTCINVGTQFLPTSCHSFGSPSNSNSTNRKCSTSSSWTKRARPDQKVYS